MPAAAEPALLVAVCGRTSHWAQSNRAPFLAASIGPTAGRQVGVWAVLFVVVPS